MIRLAVDPSLEHTGFAVVDDGEPGGSVISCGVIVPGKHKGLITIERAMRLHEIALNLDNVLYHFSIEEIFAEVAVGAIDQASAFSLFSVGGMLIGLSTGRGIPLTLITPREIKTRVFGRSDAKKKEIMAWARRTWPNAPFPTRVGDFEHIADAMAIYEAGLKKGNSRSVQL